MSAYRQLINTMQYLQITINRRIHIMTFNSIKPKHTPVLFYAIQLKQCTSIQPMPLFIPSSYYMRILNPITEHLSIQI